MLLKQSFEFEKIFILGLVVLVLDASGTPFPQAPDRQSKVEQICNETEQQQMNTDITSCMDEPFENYSNNLA